MIKIKSTEAGYNIVVTLETDNLADLTGATSARLTAVHQTTGATVQIDGTISGTRATFLVTDADTFAAGTYTGEVQVNYSGTANNVSEPFTIFVR